MPTTTCTEAVRGTCAGIGGVRDRIRLRVVGGRYWVEGEGDSEGKGLDP